eukprot:CAMPEP_0116872246 /NCGR_PEP_ID=MMETSP0463-20121206/2961_1 /TAXON_ID=181622 /ORGANISM="Strombidinopsis sp, Strain SopsisLIS2011" /LENGTH=61 /DNA_ID=CAMNT_0004512205 /DNA_START=1390 /DNA_END=1575 /DNA_ORIENTATION=+
MIRERIDMHKIEPEIVAVIHSIFHDKVPIESHLWGALVDKLYDAEESVLIKERVQAMITDK